MKRIDYLLIALTLCCATLTSCKKEKTKGAKPVSVESVDSLIAISIDIKEEGVFFDSLVNEISYVKLETTSENLIGSIHQVIPLKDKIIVTDFEVSNSIMVFDYKGRFLNKIGKFGQGPSEYISMFHVSVTPDSTNVVIADTGSKQLKYYSLSGEFIKSENIPFFFTDIELVNDEIMVGHDSGGNIINEEDTDYQPQFIAYSLKDKEVQYSGYPSYYNEKFRLTTLTPLRKFGQEVFYNPPYNDTIFKATSQCLNPSYLINFEGYPPLQVYKGITSENLGEQTKNRPYFVGNAIILKDAVVLDYFAPPYCRIPLSFYSKKKSKTYNCNGTMYNPLFHFFGTPVARYKDDTVISVARADMILFHQNDLHRLGKKEVIEDLLSGLTEDDNPVLFFFRVNI